MSFGGARVVLGVTGGIAAYKAVELCRRLVDAGAHVAPVMTEAAQRFVGPVTFDALASEPVRTSLWGELEPIPHTRLGQGADVVVVAPATARLIGCYAAGISDDLLTATLLATEAPVVICPAMHTEMWNHPAVQQNLDTLRRRGVTVVEPHEGRLAGGDVGTGRLADPEEIVEAARRVLRRRRDLAGLRVVVTAGGTREPIDPVRFVGNRSSGKQGYAIAEVAASRGAEVTLVTTVDRPIGPGVQVVRVETAAEMHEAVRSLAGRAQIVVMAAAVADFRPASPADHKLKKDALGDADAPTVVLERTPDILAELGAERRDGQTLVGFAAETADLEANARAKLTAKGVDLIVANDVSAPAAGFEHDTNQVVVFGADRHEKLSLRSKRDVAASVLDIVADLRSARPG